MEDHILNISLIAIISAGLSARTTVIDLTDVDLIMLMIVGAGITAHLLRRG
ncbi:MAG: hypothetical protein GY762_00690 [Proteobacteria bacterium]|nr:hypothetical protein [Pseudomonadota bacterium]